MVHLGDYMKHIPTLLILFLLGIIVACQPADPACPPESISYLTDSNPSTSDISQTIVEASPEIVEIKGQEIMVDQVIRGKLCSGSWRGTVYVPCDIQIYEWEQDPTFLKNCDLTIEPGTAVYVAAHNDEPYYQGCSCHTGEVGE
jgi:hypothetical protein